MNRILLALALLVSLSIVYEPTANADDAGSGSAIAVGSGSSVTVTIAPPVNPATDINGYISELQNAKQSGWPLVVLVAVFGLCELLAAAGSKVAALAWLGTGRVSIVIGGVVSISAAMINKLADGGTWVSVLLGAAVPAIALFYHPAAADVAKKLAAANVAKKLAAAELAAGVPKA